VNAMPMNRHWLSGSLVFAGLATLGLVALLWGIQSAWQEARAARRKLEFMQNELKALHAVSPAPTPRVAELIESERKVLRAARDALQEELSQPRADKNPANRTEAFFALTEFVEETRNRAQLRGVRIKPDERFGFTSYAQSGPETANIPEVFAQCLIVEHLLEALFAARPEELVGIQRCPRESFGHTAQSNAHTGSDDFFLLEKAWSAGQPGVVETTGYRLAFTGQTIALRAFLNRLADSGLPLIVRLVEVEPLPKSGQSVSVQTAHAGITLTGPAAGEAAVPLIERNSVTFTVVLEHPHLVVHPPPEA
jgi:hypothetical protein